MAAGDHGSLQMDSATAEGAHKPVGDVFEGVVVCSEQTSPRFGVGGHRRIHWQHMVSRRLVVEAGVRMCYCTRCY